MRVSTDRTSGQSPREQARRRRTRGPALLVLYLLVLAMVTPGIGRLASGDLSLGNRTATPFQIAFRLDTAVFDADLIIGAEGMRASAALNLAGS